ncbi:MAG: transglutaminase domain-containing protein [Solirubrobacterales bacterium]
MTSHGSREPRLFWEDFRRFYPLKVFALAVIIALTATSCGREASLSVAMDDLNYDSSAAKAPPLAKPAQKLHAAVVELTGLFEDQTRKDLTTGQAELARKARETVLIELAAVEEQFSADGAKLGDLDAKNALKRLAAIQSRTAEIKADLDGALSAVPTSGQKSAAARTAIEHLTALSPEPPSQPISSDLSFGIRNAEPRNVSLSAGITPAYQAPSPDAEPSSLPREPESADLEETDETKISPAIEQLAAELDHDAVRIYEFVRNRIEFEPYYGIRKGADQTLAEEAGSDADQASLLVALLRESGIPSRFVKGVVELPAAKAANWLGVDVSSGEELNAVPEILWSGGISTTPVRANGQLTKVRFAHYWVEASVPVDAYRGVDEAVGGKRWLALDPSIVERELTPPVRLGSGTNEVLLAAWLQNLAEGSSRSDAASSVLPTSSTMDAPTEALMEGAYDELAEAIDDDEIQPSEVIGDSSIRQTSAGLLPVSTVGRLVRTDAEYRDVPLSDSARIRIAVSGSTTASLNPPVESDLEGGFESTFTTVELANKRVTIRYAPASASDAEIIDSFGGVFNMPSYAGSMVPSLVVDGRVVAKGESPAQAGFTQGVTVDYWSPGFARASDANLLVVGSVNSFVYDFGASSPTQLEERAEALRSVAPTISQSNVMNEDAVGEAMAQIGASYFVRNNAFNSVGSKYMAVHSQRQLSGAMVGTNIDSSYVGGFPVISSLGGLFIDVDEDSQSVVSKTGNDQELAQFVRDSGMNASASEAQVFKNAFGNASISTATVMNRAFAEGVPIYNLDAENIDEFVGALDVSPAVRTEVESAASEAGTSILIPAREIQLAGWTGSGYVITRGSAAAYRISGGLSGGLNTSVTSTPQLADSIGGMADGALKVADFVKDFAEYLFAIPGAEEIADCASLPRDAIRAATAGILLHRIMATLPIVYQTMVGGAVVASISPLGLALALAAATYLFFTLYKLAIAIHECAGSDDTEEPLP